MTVRITSQGKPPVRAITCKYCNCGLEYGASDVEHYESWARDESATHYYVRCPSCKGTNFVKAWVYP